MHIMCYLNSILGGSESVPTSIDNANHLTISNDEIRIDLGNEDIVMDKNILFIDKCNLILNVSTHINVENMMM